MWALINETPYKAAATAIIDKAGARHWVVVVKGTFTLQGDGSTRLAKEQVDLLFTFTTDPKSALQDVIEDSDIPVAPGPPNEAPELGSIPTPAELPNEVSLQEANPPALLQGSGLGCQVGGGGSSAGLGISLHALALFLILRFWKASSEDLREALNTLG